jgi:hypothetical protein
MINNKDKIDEFFREGLDGYRVEPSEGLYGKLEARYFSSGSSRRSILVIALLLFFIAGTALVTWLALPGESPQADENAIAITTPGNRTEMTSQLQNIIENETSQDEYPNVIIADNETVSKGKSTHAPALRDLSEPGTGMTSQKIFKVFFMTGYSDNVDGHVSSWAPPPTMIEPSVKLPIYKGLENEYARKYELSAGAFFLPVMLFYDPNPNNTGWSAGVDMDYDRARFHVYAGAGVSSYKDKGTWEIQYQSYDSVGYFLNVNSFRVNPESPGEVIFNMTEEAVYESVPHIIVSEKTNSYTYFDIPAGIGFTVFSNRRLSLNVKTGITFSLLMKENEPTADFSMSGANDVFIHRMVPERNNTTWRFTAGLEASCLVTGRLSLHIEPVFGQYLNSVYVSTPGYDASKPYLFGVNIGVRYRIK